MNIEDITTGTLKSVAELIDLAEPMIQENILAPPACGWAFRGQPCEYGTLTPSFQRQFSRQSFGTAQVIEYRLIDAFRKHYNNLKDRSADMPKPERITAGFDMRCLSVMQHYEIPTRLLDWTSNFWTAIYFACASEPGNNAELWYYNRNIFQEQRVKDPLLTNLLNESEYVSPEPNLLMRRSENFVFELDPKITPRMKEQTAHHTVSTNVFSDHAPLIFELYQKFISNTDAPPMFCRVIIDASCKSKAVQFLAEEMNITASTIFPDVVGLGRFLKWQFESLRTLLF